MLINFSIQNYRSFKQKVTFSLEAGAGNLKGKNIFNIGEKSNKRLVKTAVLYGPNASGKSNLIRTLFIFRLFIINSTDLKHGDEIPYYDPFRFDKKTTNKPTTFEIEFICKDKLRYVYKVSYNKSEVLMERLDYFLKGQNKRNLFLREINKPIVLGPDFRNKKIEKNIHNLHLFLTKAANSGDKQIGEIYLYFRNIEIWNSLCEGHMKECYQRTLELYSKGSKYFRTKLKQLLKVADMKIEDIIIKERTAKDYKLPSDMTEEQKKKIIEQNRYVVFCAHKLFDEKDEIGIFPLKFDEESAGTQILFNLGGLLINILEKGGILIVDELNNSLHTDLSNFLIDIVHSPEINIHNAQLIFTTHDISLINNRNLFRKDQIWLTDKDKYGVTDLYSLKEYDIRENTPFGKWYMQGKFEAKPKIKEKRFILSHE